MTNSPGSRGFFPRRLGRHNVAFVAIGLPLFVAWLFLSGCNLTERGEVRVYEAQLRSSDRLALIVDSCNGNPEVSLLRETDVDVQVKVVAGSTPLQGGDDCLDTVEVQLQNPLGDRVVVDKHTGQSVSVNTFNSSSDHGEEPSPPDVAPAEIGDPPNTAELEDLQTLATQKGISLQAAIDRYAWNDNFALAVQKIRETSPEAFAGAEIVDGARAWIGFADGAPAAARDWIDVFSNSNDGVSVEVRAGLGFTEVEKQRAVEAAHYAVFEAPGVLDASTSFDFATRQITTNVVLESTVSDSIFDDLRAVGVKALTDATRADILDGITYSVVRSNSEILGGDD